MITTTHCQQCGSTSSEDVDFRVNDGYTACCNERIVGGNECDETCHHGEAWDRNDRPVTGRITEVPDYRGGRRSVKYLVTLSTGEHIGEFVFKDQAQGALTNWLNRRNQGR